jgi:hypothetical protein
MDMGNLHKRAVPDAGTVDEGALVDVNAYARRRRRLV